MTIRGWILGGTLIFAAGVGTGYLVRQFRQPVVTSTALTAKLQPESKQLGPWKAAFRVPQAINIPESAPMLRCQFERSGNLEFLTNPIVVKMSNLQGESYAVHYHVFGYNPKGERISDGEDEFAIGPKETVVRSLRLTTQAPETEMDFKLRFGSTFWLELVLEQ